ncbi:MAG TPA: HEAT repeat domain-containing protein [Ktedonobacteraceae bacterium]|nr:HEAT repeat domain-containing protein [Ktedonobacteraceae bacterium]
MAIILKDRVSPPESDNSEKSQIQPGFLGISPAPGKLPERGERMWVDRPDQLLLAASVLEKSQIIAIDAEFTQVRARTQGDTSTSSHRLALLQLAVNGHCYVIDALRLNNLSLLAEIVENPEHTILLHGAGADLRVMSERDLNVAHYMDLEAASRSIFGQHESSLAAMLQRAFQTRLDKSLQRTDWTRRPLPPAMVAYAARDAEMTLALYYWLNEHYPWALQLHENTLAQEPVAAWIEPFLRGTAQASVEVTVAEARGKGSLTDEEIIQDCRAALLGLRQPMRRSRLLRLIADLSLLELVPEIEPLLLAPTSDERSAAARALGRMGSESSKEAIQPLLNDPVQDVRKAAQTALRNLQHKDEPRESLATTARHTDGSRSWTVGETDTPEVETDWKARLRAMMDN